MPSDNDKIIDLLTRQTELLEKLVAGVGAAIEYMHKAEREVPEYARRFVMYYHDVHDIMNLHHEFGLPVPPHVQAEVERCDDRLKHILEDENNQGGTFYKVAQSVRERGGGRYIKEEPKSETGSSESQRQLGRQARTDLRRR